MASRCSRRGVAGVALPAVLGMANGQTRHHPVANDLRDDGRAGDRIADRVAVHDRRVRTHVTLEAGNSQPVDEDVVVSAEPGDRPTHREVGRVIDVQLVDLAHGGCADADGDGPAPDDRGEPFTLCGREGLRIADACDPAAVGRHDDGRRDDRTGRGSDPDLIDTGNPPRALGPERSLEAEAGYTRGHRR